MACSLFRSSYVCSMGCFPVFSGVGNSRNVSCVGHSKNRLNANTNTKTNSGRPLCRGEQSRSHRKTWEWRISSFRGSHRWGLLSDSHQLLASLNNSQMTFKYFVTYKEFNYNFPTTTASVAPYSTWLEIILLNPSEALSNRTSRSKSDSESVTTASQMSVSRTSSVSSIKAEYFWPNSSVSPEGSLKSFCLSSKSKDQLSIRYWSSNFSIDNVTFFYSFYRTQLYVVFFVNLAITGINRSQMLQTQRIVIEINSVNLRMHFVTTVFRRLKCNYNRDIWMK